MAEIKRYTSQGTFNKPIGVVTPSRAGVQAAQTMASTFGQMSDMFYKQAVDEQVKVGKEAALSFRTRDENQNLVVKQAPSTLSPVAQAKATEILDQRYQAAFLADAKNRASVLRKQHERDPEGFNAAYTAYIDETMKTAGKYSGYVSDIGGSILAENTAAVTVEQLEFEDRIAYQNDFELTKGLILDAAADYSSGNYAAGQMDITAAERAIQNLQDQHGDRLSVTAIPELRKELKRARLGGSVEFMATQLKSIVGDPLDPKATTTGEIAAINAMESALRAGTTQNLPEPMQEILAQIGFTDDFVSREVTDQETASVIAADLSTMEGNLQEIYNQEKRGRALNAIAISLQNGNDISGSDANDVFEANGFSNSYQLAGEFENIVNDTNSPLNHVLFKTNSVLPDAVQDMFEDPAQLQAMINDGKLPILTNAYRQMTTRMNPATGQVNRVSRGLDDKAIVLMDTLIAYEDAGIGDVERFFQRKQEFDRLPKDQRDAQIKSELGDTSLADFVSETVEPENIEQRAFASSFADELILIHGSKKAKNILKNAMSRVFVQDSLMYGTTKTRFAPKRAYPSDTEMNVFKQSVQSQLNRADKLYELGMNAFLVADPRYGSVYPVYNVVDAAGVQISIGSEPLRVGPNSVIAHRQRTMVNAREEADKQRKIDQGLIDQGILEVGPTGVPYLKGR